MMDASSMSSLRLTVIMFIIGAALAPAIFVGFGRSGTSAPATDGTERPIAIEPAAFAPAGLKRAPWDGAARPVEPGKDPKAAPVAGIAVVELFTSEGCSSCPPADRVLADLVNRHGATPGFHALAFHVDYWDKLGWKDRFASAEFTARQREYSAAFDGGRMYTPQIVVNGMSGFVGSDAARAERAVTEGLKLPARAIVEVAPIRIEPGKRLTVSCTVTPRPGGQLDTGITVLICLVEDGLKSTVSRGENEGRELEHERVVRVATPARFVEGGAGRYEASLEVPSDLKPERSRIVALVRDAKLLRIIGAGDSRWASDPGIPPPPAAR